MTYETVFSAFEFQMKCIDSLKSIGATDGMPTLSSMLTSVAYWARPLRSTYICTLLMAEGEHIVTRFPKLYIRLNIIFRRVHDLRLPPLDNVQAIPDL